eukprot:3655273-Prymnesium_polylepis.1
MERRAHTQRRFVCMDRATDALSTRKRARQHALRQACGPRCGPLPHVVRVGSEHLSGLSGSATAYCHER